jgi:monovalent cation/proton antiporter MnhG/PhaG subunit
VSASLISIDVLLALGTACQVICCIGVVAGRDAFDKLHYAGAASTMGPILILAAILIRHGVTAPGLQTIVAVVLLISINPVLVHATAQAARRVIAGQIEPTDAELARAEE